MHSVEKVNINFFVAPESILGTLIYTSTYSVSCDLSAISVGTSRHGPVAIGNDINVPVQTGRGPIATGTR